MSKMFNRQFFTLDPEETILKVTNACEYPCAAMKTIPKEKMTFHTDTKPPHAGVFFNADVLQEHSQRVLVVREHLTSFTEAAFIPNELKHTLRDYLIVLITKL